MLLAGGGTEDAVSIFSGGVPGVGGFVLYLPPGVDCRLFLRVRLPSEKHRD